MKFILWFLRRLKKPKIKSKIMLKDNRPLLRNFKKILKKYPIYGLIEDLMIRQLNIASIVYKEMGKQFQGDNLINYNNIVYFYFFYLIYT